MKILFLSHTNDEGGLAKASLETLTAAAELASQAGAELCFGLFGGAVKSAADTAAGAADGPVYAVEGADFAQPRYASDAAAATAIVKQAAPDLVLAPADSRMSRIIAGVAARSGGVADTQATALAAEGGKVSATRWYYRQRMFAQITREQTPWFVSVASGVFAPFAGQAKDASVESVAVDLPEIKTTVKGLETPDADEQTIRPDAELLLVAGAGWMKKQADGAAHVKDAESLISAFLGETKASLGSSKSLVDITGEGQEVISFLTHLHQVGQTGSTPRHKKGLATCCHGEEPHVVGWRFITERRAVNLDASCGWAQGKADVLYVADAFAVMAKVNELL